MINFIAIKVIISVTKLREVVSDVVTFTIAIITANANDIVIIPLFVVTTIARSILQ